jgi:hypothetical protein
MPRLEPLQGASWALLAAIAMHSGHFAGYTTSPMWLPVQL